MNQNRLGNISNITNLAAKIITPLLKKQGISDSKLLDNWTQIVGKELATKTIPLKITKDHKAKKKTLHIAVSDSSMALIISYQANLILEKIRLSLGSDFIQQIKIIQTSIPAVEKTEEIIKKTLSKKIEFPIIEDEEINEALAILGSYIANK